MIRMRAGALVRPRMHSVRLAPAPPHLHQPSRRVNANTYRRSLTPLKSALVWPTTVIPTARCQQTTRPASSTLCHRFHAAVEHAQLHAACTLLPVLTITPTTSLAPSSLAYTGESAPWVEWLASTKPVQLTITALEWLHTTTGTSWALTFVLAALATRTLVIPLVVYQTRVIHDITRLRPHFLYIKQLVAKSKLSPVRKMIEASRIRWSLYRKYRCHPVKLLLPTLSQLSFLACIALSIRPLVFTSPDIRTGGLCWFENLALSDPYYVLPLTITALYYAQTVIGDRIGKVMSARRQRELEQAMQRSSTPLARTPSPGLTQSLSPSSAGSSETAVTVMDTVNYYKGSFIILVLPLFFSFMPAGVAVFQITGAVWSIAQMLVLHTDRAKALLGTNTAMRPIFHPHALSHSQSQSAAEPADREESIRHDIRELVAARDGTKVASATVAPVFVKREQVSLVKPRRAKS